MKARCFAHIPCFWPYSRSRSSPAVDLAHPLNVLEAINLPVAILVLNESHLIFHRLTGTRAECYDRGGGVARFNGNIIRTACKPGNIFGKLRLWISCLIFIRKLIVRRLIVLILQGGAEGIQWYIRRVNDIVDFPDAATIFDEKRTLLH